VLASESFGNGGKVSIANLTLLHHFNEPFGLFRQPLWTRRKSKFIKKIAQTKDQTTRRSRLTGRLQREFEVSYFSN
jgi:hypothetical protein